MTVHAGVTDHRMIIGGERVAPSEDRWLEVVDPYLQEVWARVPVASPDDVARAVDAARIALVDSPWSSLTPGRRRQALLDYAAVLDAHVEELTTLQVRENGKAIREQFAQTTALGEHLRYFAGLCEQLRGATIPIGVPSTLCYTLREPIGVVGALTPWNSPLSLLMWKLAPALAAGNTLVVKPSEISPVSTLAMVALADEAGLPAGVLNVVTGAGEVGALLAAHPGVDKVAFTGSTAAGREVGKTAIDHLARISLELGGKSPSIVFADADLDRAVEGVVGGIFAAAGQTCIAGSRVLVQETVYEEFADRLAARVARIRLGNPLDWETEVGTISCLRQYEKIESYVAIALAEGARLVAGGGRPTAPGLETGFFFAPTIFADVRNDMRIAREEVFGPVVCLLRFLDEDDAVAQANDSDFGLAAGVWTQSGARAHRIAARLRVGTVWINTYRKTNHAVPFGGFRHSGIGRENGVESLLEYTELKVVWADLGEATPDPFNPTG